MKKINLALVGYGFSGSTFHLPTIKENKNYHIKYIMTRNKDRQAQAKRDCKDVIIATDYSQILNDHTVDVVILATSNKVHYAYTKEALEHGKHVVCEKPFVKSYKTAKKLFDLAEEKNLILRVFHNRKYDGDVLTLKQLLNDIDFGKIVSFHARFDQFKPEIGENWRFKNVEMGGLFYDLAPHLVHYTIDLFGMPKKVYNKLYKDRANMTVDDRFEMILYYDTFECHLSAQMLARDPNPKFQIIGTHATYTKYGYDEPETIHTRQKDIYQLDQQNSYLVDNHKHKESIKVLKGKHYLFYELLAQHIYKKPEKDIDKFLSLGVIHIMEMAMKSQNTEKIIEIKTI